MSVFYINENDCILKKVDERVKLIKDKITLADIPLIKITEIVIFGRVTVTHEVFEELSRRKISLCYLSEYGKYKTRLETNFSKNIILRVNQYKNNFDNDKKCKISAGFVKGKLSNYRMAILSLQREKKEIDFSSSINLLKELIKKLDNCNDLDKIRGYEGCGSAEYFKNFKYFIKNPEFIFKKREKHPPPDPINALLSLGYSLLRNDIDSAINIVGFDPYLGYLHSEHYGRASLSFDLMEEFRPLLVDSVVISMINRNQITQDDFREELPNSFLLKDEARKTFFKAYEQRKLTEFKHPYFNYKVNYLRCFELQCRILAKFLNEEIDEYVPLIMR
ncbi:MAG: CRISPR-associated endonuclease Cas1 [Candidatus Sericytochromatia bacterium]